LGVLTQDVFGMQIAQDYEARARQLRALAGRTSDAFVSVTQRQLANAYVALARWRQRRRQAGPAGRYPGRDEYYAVPRGR